MESVRRDCSEELRHTYRCSPRELSSHEARYERLAASFAASFSARPDRFVVRAPGRVNLIGEHTDYNGYPVLPMALDRDIVFVIAPRRDSVVDLLNENPRFERRTFPLEFPVEPSPQGDWGNYVKAAIQGILEAGEVDPRKAVGFDGLIGGTIPESAGLSSSSALVVGSALAFLAANKTRIDHNTLADLLARAERYVGSEGGGMDQAVSLLAQAGKALRIGFFPLRTEPVRLPEEISFVVCNSLIRAPKSEAVRYAYNRRVIECRIATALLSKAIEQKTGQRIQAARLADLAAERLRIEPRALNDLALQGIGEEPLSLNTVARHLGESLENVKKNLCTLRDGSVLKEPVEGFQVWRRYRHVVKEAGRVDSMVKALRDGDVSVVGSLMNQSHASCRDDYEVSCPELEALVSIARGHGAIGARLTGAGFGGCTVNAVPLEKVEEFVRGVTEEYYLGYVKQHGKAEFAAYQDLSDVIFPCRATMGAGAWPAEEIVG
jgi:N-acetylgalactosamine kinase